MFRFFCFVLCFHSVVADKHIRCRGCLAASIAMAQLLTEAECKAIASLGSDIIGLDDFNTRRTLRWLRSGDGAPTRVTPNKSGVSGWCILDGNRDKRVHICAHDPCNARHDPAKYGLVGPPDAHVRVSLHAHSVIALSPHAIPTPTDDTAHIHLAPPAPSLLDPNLHTPLGLPAPSLDTTPHLPSPPPGDMLGPHADDMIGSCVPSPTSPAPDSPDDDLDSDSDSDVRMEYGETHGDVAAVAPEPPPFVPAGGALCIPPPPERAALRPIVAAKASNRPPEPPQQHATVADEDEEDISVATGLTNPAVANELNTFMTQVSMADRKYVGIAAYLVFSFLYRKRVAIWFHGRRHDIVNECAPWAIPFITDMARKQKVMQKAKRPNRMKIKKR